MCLSVGIEPRPQRWEARVLPLCHRGPSNGFKTGFIYLSTNVFTEFIFENERPFIFMFVLYLVKTSSCQDIVESFVASFSINQRS